MALELPPDDDVGPEILMEKGTLSMSCPVVDLVTPSRAIQRLPSLECLDKGYYIFYCFIDDGNIHCKT